MDPSQHKELIPELILLDANPMKGINPEVNPWELRVNVYSLLKNQLTS